MERSREMQRREFLSRCAKGLSAGGLYPLLSLAASIKDGHPLAPKPSHFPAKAKRMVFLYLTGGFSHVDTFDPKPRLRIDHGKPIAGESLRSTNQLPLLGSPFEFQPCGRSGLMISELFPELQKCADD